MASSLSNRRVIPPPSSSNLHSTGAVQTDQSKVRQASYDICLCLAATPRTCLFKKSMTLPRIFVARHTDLPVQLFSLILKHGDGQSKTSHMGSKALHFSVSHDQLRLVLGLQNGVATLIALFLSPPFPLPLSCSSTQPYRLSFSSFPILLLHFHAKQVPKSDLRDIVAYD